MGKSSGSVLELKLMNCKDLQAFNFFQKLSVYAVVSFISDVDPNNNQQQQQQQQQQQHRTPTDNQGDKDPEWNHEMRFNLNLGHDTKEDDSDFLRFDLRSELALFGDKSLGEVRVLLKDLMDEVEEEYRSAPNGIVRFVSYEVRTSDGKPNGILSFSYKLLLMNEHKDDQGSITSSSSSPINKYNGHTHMDGYPILDLDHPHPHPHHHNNGCDDESYYSAMAYHQIHYPSLEMPYPAPAPAPAPGESYINYPHPHDALFNSQPPSVPLPPVLPLLFQPPFPPPPPPPHHHHVGEGAVYPPPHPPPPFPPPPPPPHHHHVGEGAVYPPPSPWVYAQSYPDHEAPNPLEFPCDYAYPRRLHNPYYMGDPTPHSR